MKTPIDEAFEYILDKDNTSLSIIKFEYLIKNNPHIKFSNLITTALNFKKFNFALTILRHQPFLPKNIETILISNLFINSHDLNFYNFLQNIYQTGALSENGFPFIQNAFSSFIEVSFSDSQHKIQVEYLEKTIKNVESLYPKTKINFLRMFWQTIIDKKLQTQYTKNKINDIEKINSMLTSKYPLLDCTTKNQNIFISEYKKNFPLKEGDVLTLNNILLQSSFKKTNKTKKINI